MTKIKPGSILGIIGGGQLGRMTALAAASLGLRVHVFCDHQDSPAEQVCDKVMVAPYDDLKALEHFAKSVDVVTFEFENIPHASVKALEKVSRVRPGWKTLHIAQNRIREKEFLNSIGIPTAPYKKISSAKALQEAYKELGPKCILKTSELGYDGKGQHIIDKNSKLPKLWKDAKMDEGVLEKFVRFKKEISVIVARGEDGGSVPYMPAENIHKGGILDTTIAPADVSEKVMEAAWDAAHDIADALDIQGVLAVEFFLLKDDSLLVNEIAPRPHNSGHWTLDACITSQFEQFVRAVCGLPLGSTDYHSRAIMKNLIGDDINTWEEFISDPDTKVHLYGKKEARKGRKMGHVTTLISSDDAIVSG